MTRFLFLFLSLAGCTGAVENPSLKAKGSVAAIEWVRVEGGEFLYGCESGGYPGQAVGEWTETAPSVDVMRFHATVADWRACVSAGACVVPLETAQPVESCTWNRGNESAPVNCMKWEHAAAFCEWAGGRLPSSKEWEHAARGSDGRTYPWGEDDPACATSKARAWCGQPFDAGPVSVGSFPSGQSENGLFDMAGNMWTWISDVYEVGPGGGNGYDPSLPHGHELRGGRWNRSAMDLRSCIRHFSQTGEEGAGVRCVRDVP